MGVINFTFILVDEMSLLWIVSGHDVKLRRAKAGPLWPPSMPSSTEAEHTLLFMLLLGWVRNAVTNKNKKIFVLQ